MISGSNRRGQILGSWLAIILLFSVLFILLHFFHFIAVRSEAEDQEFRSFRKSLIEGGALVQ